MKKTFLFVCTLMLSTMAWAGYGILVNGCEYYEGTKVDEFEGFQQYLAHVTFAKGDYCELYDADNQAAWVVPLNTASVAGFAVKDGKIQCTTDGCFDCYIKLKYQEDQLYIGNGSNCGKPQNLCPTTGFSIAGNGVAGNPWVCGLNWQAAGCELGETNSITFESVPAGSYAFKITNGTWEKHWGGAYVDAKASTPGYATDIDGNVAFKIAETADITISFDGKAIVFLCSAPLQPIYVSSVPSQCTDVLMQGFYWDSYAVSEDTPGTDKYGDTRWTTLLKHAGEIGAYFDLIWLPPSALASGTGYHPKQYSNQSGDWGSRAELQQLIKTLHNSGTKVVADMVINHMDAQGAWCDLSIQNFGEYGIFVPDVSWISKDDEMNWPENNVDTLAGECWGLASGPKEDAPWYDGNNEANYTSARDWAHAKPEVQEMCRAYSKWMRTEIGYDGFRYDYCKGLHASHFDDYNRAGEAYISFLELWASNDAMKQAIQDANYNTMVLDFQSKYSWVDELGKWGNYVGRGWGMMADDAWKKYAVVWLDSHDNFLRGNGGEFGGEDGKSMDSGLKYDRLMQANAEMLSMPGIPCVFYPHWYKYNKELKEMINARHCAGVHNESEVKDEYWDKEGDFNKGYQATIIGKNGFIVLQLGTKATKTSWDPDLKLMSSGNGYSVWVKANDPVAPRLIVTPDAFFEDTLVGIDATIEAVGGTQRDVKIYYTTDGTDPTTASTLYTPGDTLHFYQTTTLKVIGVDGTAVSNVQTYTYTYREPLKRGIQVHFRKPEKWDRVYFYAWQTIISATDTTTTNLMGAYPGQRIYQDQEGWFSYEFANDLDSVTFCINSGNECGELNVRSNDLRADYDVCYGWQDATDTLSYYEILLDCETTEINPDFGLVISPETGYFRDSEAGQEVKINVVGADDATIYFTKSTDPKKTFTAQNDTTFTVLESTTISAYAVTDGGLTTPVCEETYTYKEPQMGPLNVKFVKPHDWKNICLYAFTRVKVGAKYKDTAYPLDGVAANAKWPGRKFKETEFEKIGEDSVYSYTFPADIKEIYVIFNIGSNKKQTQDIFLDEDACYEWSDECWRAVYSLTCGDEPSWLNEVGNAQCTMHNGKFMVEKQLYIKVGDSVFDVWGRKIE